MPRISSLLDHTGTRQAMEWNGMDVNIEFLTL